MDSTILNLITPAIIISIVVFLVRFYGKIICEPKPFADDKNWQIESSGIFFFIILLPSIMLGGLLAWYAGDLYTNHLARLLLLIFSIIWMLRINDYLLVRLYEIKSPQNFNFGKKMNDLEFSKKTKKFLKVNYYIAIWFLPFLYAFIIICEYKSGSLGWEIFNGMNIFLGLITIATTYSIGKLPQLQHINIFFINDKEPIKDAVLIKISNDNVRIKKGASVFMITKGQIDRIEFLPITRDDSLQMKIIDSNYWFHMFKRNL